MFKLKEHGTKTSTEIIAGATTFFAMAYIIFVNPAILSATGMSRDGVFVATILATVIGTLIMALVANVPYATAPGMGLNAFFTYTVCFTLGFQWQEALAMVFICGIINILITVTKVRKVIIKSIPLSLQSAIGGGIGLFIAYIGLKNANLINFASTADGFTAGSAAVPSLAKFDTAGVLLAVFGLVLIAVLLIKKVKGAMFIGIIATTIVGVIAGAVKLPAAGEIFNLQTIGANIASVKDVAFAFFGEVGFKSLFSDPSKIFIVILTVFAFSLSDTFDTIGTFIGTGRKTGIFDAADEKALYEGKGFKSKMDKALFADSIATSIGALAGTSNTTTYVESAAGIEAGGRTGLTSLVTSVLFLLCLPLSALFGIVPSEATAPVLIIVGVLMASSFKEINWTDLEDALPAFFTVLVMAFAYSISYGIAAGFIFYCIVKICKGKVKELHPILIGATVLFIINFAVLAVTKLQ
ncbi:permease [Clostridia bacterium]|nr:permease [Clostridia bacterium]